MAIVSAIVGAVTVGGAVYYAASNAGVIGDELVTYTIIGAVAGAIVGGLIGYFLPSVVPAVTQGVGFTLPKLIMQGGQLAYTTTTVVVSGEALTASFTGLLGLILLFSRWEPGSWPGDDPTQAPGDGFEWRGPGEIGSSKGEWYNPSTGDQLHPDLNHPLPKGPHWGWKNKILKILKDIFKGGK